MTGPGPQAELAELAEHAEFRWEHDDGAGGMSRILVRQARSGEFVDAYPAGTHDRELRVDGRPDAQAVAELTRTIFRADPSCRRVVLPVLERDLDAIAWAETAGYRYVVDVEVRSGGYSLMVAEPDWVLSQPQVLDDIPLKE